MNYSDKRQLTVFRDKMVGQTRNETHLITDNLRVHVNIYEKCAFASIEEQNYRIFVVPSESKKNMPMFIYSN